MEEVNDFQIGKDLEVKEVKTYMRLTLTNHPSSKKGLQIEKNTSNLNLRFRYLGMLIHKHDMDTTIAFQNNYRET